jgi:hypothetical protein
MSGPSSAPPAASAVKPKRAWERPSWTVAETLRGLGRGLNAPLLILGALVWCAGLVSLARGEQSEKLLVWLLLAPCFTTAIAMVIIWKAALPRFFFFAIGLGAIVLARGIVVAVSFLSALIKADARGQRIVTAVLAAAIIAVSLFSLRAQYVFPKQDILGAVEYVEEHRQQGDLVMTIWPLDDIYQLVFGKEWRIALTSEQMLHLTAHSRTVWTIYSLPGSMKSYRPKMWKVLQEYFEVVKVLPGTLGDGDVYICRSRFSKSSGHRP